MIDMDMPIDSSSASTPMVFTTSYAGFPVLFQTFQPTTKTHLFGFWITIFSIAIFYRSLGCLRNHLEATYWSPRYLGEHDLLGQKGRFQPFSIMRDGGRALLVFVTAILGYTLMLVVMSFVVVCGI